MEVWLEEWLGPSRKQHKWSKVPHTYRPNALKWPMCSTSDHLRCFRLGPSHSSNQTSVTLVCANHYSTHSSALILKRSTVFLCSCFTAKSAILRKYTRIDVIDVNMEGIAAYSTRSPLQTNVGCYHSVASHYTQCTQAQGLPCPFNDVTWSPSRPSPARSTATGRQIMGVAVGHFGRFFTHKTMAKSYEKYQWTVHYQNMKKEKNYMIPSLLAMDL